MSGSGDAMARLDELRPNHERLLLNMAFAEPLASQGDKMAFSELLREVPECGESTL